ncbi:MAG: TolC family protein [Planctomycetia bacterium]|nr:TolC family protein [Planctomycetia bacterium]
MDHRSRAFVKRCRQFGQFGLPLLLGGCADLELAREMLLPPAAVARASAPQVAREVVRAADATAGGSEESEEPTGSTPHGSPPLSSSSREEEGREASKSIQVPISLETVLRLAEDQNPQLALARARVAEANAACDLAQRWLPDIYIGTGYYRHEGGIQLEDGTLIRSSTGANLNGLDIHGRLNPKEIAFQRISAQRKVLQQKGELSKLTNENLLDAANTYLDLLTVRTGEAIARDMLKDLEDLANQAEKRAEAEPAARVEIARVRAEIAGRQQNIRKLRAQGEAAGAKLIYLLGLDSCSLLVPVDEEIIPVNLVDATPPVCELIDRAMAGGPGIEELQGMVNLVEDAIARSKGPVRFMPSVELRMTEGAFGAGPGSVLDYENRWDMALVFRWNLTDLATRHDRQRVADAQRQQAHLAYHDLRTKLTAGVRESRESILSGVEEIQLGKEQIKHARSARQLAKERVEKNIPGSSVSEVLLSLQSLAMAQLGHLNAIREYDRAQLRLMLLIGCQK